MLKLFVVSGKFLVPGSRKVATQAPQKVFARDVAHVCRQMAPFLAEKVSARISPDFVRMHLKIEDCTLAEAREVALAFDVAQSGEVQDNPLLQAEVA